jgi:GMP synthase-like glutamine amidotransferase
VGLAREAEVGMLRVTRLTEYSDNAFLSGIPHEVEVLQWHGAEVTRAPVGATVLASSPKCANQAMSVGNRALSIQFHIEVTTDMIGDWNAIPEYHCALEESLGNGGASDLVTKMNQHTPVLSRYAQTLYENWKRCAGWC